MACKSMTLPPVLAAPLALRAARPIYACVPRRTVPGNRQAPGRAKSAKSHITPVSMLTGYEMSKQAKIFIDGAAGTTGLEIRERLAGRNELSLMVLPEAQRKDAAAR